MKDRDRYRSNYVKICLGGQRPPDLEACAREYDLLLNLPHVNCIAVDNAGIRVWTDAVTLRASDGRDHRIGRFRIEVVPGEGVTIRNLDSRARPALRNLDHPHVLNGRACVKGTADSIAAEMAQPDFAAVIRRTMELLRTYEPDRALADIGCWPVHRPTPQCPSSDQADSPDD